jgi:hypothetical protein
MKIHPLGAELFRADGRTDRHDEANNLFSKFYKNISKEWLDVINKFLLLTK